MIHSLLLLLVAICGSTFGSLLGLGGGIIIVPLFTLFLGVDPKVAVAASAIAIVTNSVVGSTRHLGNRYVNIRLALSLEVTMVIGAFIGASVAVSVSERLLKGLLGALVFYAAWTMLRGRKEPIPPVDLAQPDPHRLRAAYTERSGEQVVYQPERLGVGISVSAVAGLLSGMLGIGGGIVQVPVMNLVMKLPVRAATGTSSFMIGTTAVASALVFYAHGQVDPRVVVPAMIGVLIGSTIGSTLTRRLHPARLTAIFVVVMVYLGLSMLLDATGIRLLR